jgi:tRNA(adenine34) deaminase
MNDEQDSKFMELALAQSELALSRGQAPFGAVVVSPAGEVIGEGYNTVRADFDVSAHGEVSAIRAACKRLGNFNLKGYTIYTSTEPCLSCSFLITQLEMGRVVYAARGTDVPGYKPLLNADFSNVAEWVNRQPDWPPVEVRGEFLRECAIPILLAYFKR